jgi:tetratricopeptide (TPR) repeat protein
MNYSTIYSFYPDNRALEKALRSFVDMLVEYDPRDIKPDNQVLVSDNFSNTRGNYEQHVFRATLLEPAREVFETELTDEFRQQAPLEWAQTQNHLGNVLAAMAQQLRDEALYGKAIAAFESALEVLDQEATPAEWATTQYNLGTAAQALGRQESSSKLLKQAIDAYTSALLVWNQDKNPDDWAHAMHQLGNSFHAHGLLLKGNRQLQKSVVAYKNALKVFNADDHALALAATHNNRGAVLHHLAESEDNADRMKEAIHSYETGLLVCQEQQLPIHLAVLVKVNIATARGVLAELTKDALLAEEVADDFEVIVECFPHALQPLCLKHCQEQINKARSLTVADSASG